MYNYNSDILNKLGNVPVSHGCPFASYGPTGTGEVSLLYHVVYFAKYGPKPRI